MLKDLLHFDISDLKHFLDDNEVLAEVERWFSYRSAGFNEDSIKGVFHRFEKYVELEMHLLSLIPFLFYGVNWFH